MFKTKLFSIAVMLSALVMSGCASNIFPGGPTPAGMIVTNVRGPAQYLTVATDKDARSTKVGVASVSAIAGLFAFGDASIDKAMKTSGITKVHHVDHQFNSFFFGLWIRNTTIVHGE